MLSILKETFLAFSGLIAGKEKPPSKFNGGSTVGNGG